MTTTTHLVLGDQLTRQVGPLAHDEPTRVLMIESRALLSEATIHAQKAVLFLSAMRHFADELRDAGLEVDYLRHDDAAASEFASGVADHLDRIGAERIVAMRPNDHGVADAIEAAVDRAGATMDWRPNELWICADATFDAWAEHRSSYRLEDFYRTMRRTTGILMDGGEPLGDRWNFDEENRSPPPSDRKPPPVEGFEEDAITREVQDEVERFEQRWGDLRPFRWPVTRSQALEALDRFLHERLPSFGTYQDAMLVDEPFLWHSTLSVPLNLGLLHPREVLDAALARAAARDDAAGGDAAGDATGDAAGGATADAAGDATDEDEDVPMNAIEGFVRQILGWREFVHQVYRTRGEAMREANVLQAQDALPPAFWGERTELRCLGTTVAKLHENGYTHHIERLMVLGNLAQLANADPIEVLDWFTATHVDALDWVMVPNVLGMSQYADGGSMTSKPYAAGANYLNRMSDACGACRFDPKARGGRDACPVTDWYWAFIDRHQQRFRENHRMRMIAAAWRKRDADDRRRLKERAAARLERFRDGRL